MKAKAGRDLASLLENEERSLSEASGRERHYRLLVNWKLGDVFLYCLGWTLLVIFSAGIAMFFLPYSVMQRLLNGVVMIDDEGQPVGRLSAEANMVSQFGHIVTWFFIHFGVLILGIITLRTAGFLLLPAVTLLYYLSVGRTMIEQTHMVSHEE